MPFPFDCCLDWQGWHCRRPTIVIDGDHREIAGIRVPPGTLPNIFRFNSDSDFHRSSSPVINARPKCDEFADIYRLLEYDLVD
jgi:hypothetical protein